MPKKKAEKKMIDCPHCGRNMPQKAKGVCARCYNYIFKGVPVPPLEDAAETIAKAKAGFVSSAQVREDNGITANDLDGMAADIAEAKDMEQREGLRAAIEKVEASTPQEPPMEETTEVVTKLRPTMEDCAEHAQKVLEKAEVKDDITAEAEDMSLLDRTCQLGFESTPPEPPLSESPSSDLPPKWLASDYWDDEELVVDLNPLVESGMVEHGDALELMADFAELARKQMRTPEAEVYALMRAAVRMMGLKARMMRE